MIRVDSLVIEVGRKCNRNCKHCLRGTAEDKTICLEDVFALLNQIDSINCITFSGGEPTLYGKEISAIVDYIIDNHINVGNFYVASNGELYNEDLMLALVRLYAYCDMYGDNEITCFDVSADQFHQPKKEVLSKLRAFAFFGKRGIIPDSAIINEGNAAEYDIGVRSLDHWNDFYITEELWGKDLEHTIEMVYLNAEGFLFACCDFSYETQRQLPHYRTIAEIIECPVVANKDKIGEIQ